jgi:hypothetical protein
MISTKLAALTLVMAALVVGLGTFPAVWADDDKKDDRKDPKDHDKDKCCDDGDNKQVAIISDDDTNTQVNSATVVQTQGDGDFNTQAASVTQSNTLEDNDVNTILQSICDEVFFC